MTAAAPPSAAEMSKTILEQIAKAVADGGDAAAARAALADALKGQGGAVAAAANVTAPETEAQVIEAEWITRPNGDKYWLRKLGKHSDVAALRKAREDNIFALAYGEPGTGKSALFEAAYAGDDLPEEQRAIYTISGTGDTETADFVGGYIQLPNGQYEWVDGPLILAMEAGATLNVDEIAMIDPKVLSVLYPVMDGRGEIRITANPDRGIVKAKPGFYVVASCNPNAPGARMSEAMLSRFPLQFEVGTDYNLAKRLGVPVKMVTAAQNMSRKAAKGELGWAPQLRELLAFKTVHAALGEEVAIRNMIAGAPEIDRPQVMDILVRAYSMQVTGLSVE